MPFGEARGLLAPSKSDGSLLRRALARPKPLWALPLSVTKKKLDGPPPLG